MDAEGNHDEQIYRPRWQKTDRKRQSQRSKNSVLPIIAPLLGKLGKVLLLTRLLLTM